MPSKTDINPSTGKAYAVNPSTGNWDDNYWANTVEPSLRAQNGQSSSGLPSVASQSSYTSGPAQMQDPVKLAQQLIQTQQEANKPAISTLQGQIDPLKQRYSDLIDSIKAQGTVASNYAQQSASMDLGRRGLLPQSQEGQQALSNALLPVQAQTQGALGQTGVAEQGDINTIQNAIAALQSSNPSAAVQSAITAYTNQNQVIPYGGGLYNLATGKQIAGGGGSPLTLNTGNTTPVAGASATTSAPTTRVPLQQIFGGNTGASNNTLSFGQGPTLNLAQALASGGLTFS